MTSMLILMLLHCSLNYNNNKPVSSVWRLIEYNDSTKPYEHYDLSSPDVGLIPFYWKEINYSSLDSMLSKTQEYDSIINLYVNETIDYTLEPIKINSNGVIVGYNHKEIVKIDSCEYEVCIFYAAKREELISHDNITFYYLKNFGIIWAVHKLYRVNTWDWRRYVLIDLENQNRVSIVNKKILQEFV